MNFSLKMILFCIGVTGFISWFSWYASLKEKRWHGIARFFSFESIFLIVVLNYRQWFDHPFSLLQIISWILLSASLVLAAGGFYQLKVKGKPEGSLENTTRLIQSGLFKTIRHPLYLSLLLLGFGALLKKPGVIQTVLAVINSAALFLTAKIEEKEMIEKFGNEYLGYMKKTKMFIPYLL